MWVCAAILFAFSNMIRPVGVSLLILLIVYVLLVELLQGAEKQKYC